MHKVFLYLFLLFIPAELLFHEPSGAPHVRNFKLSAVICRNGAGWSSHYAAFEQAVAGYNKITQKDKEILTLVDFSKPSTEERFLCVRYET